MSDESESGRSRRDFLRIAAALTASGAVPRTGLAKHTENASSTITTTAADNDWHNARQTFHNISLNGKWSVLSLPVQAEGAKGYEEFKRGGEIIDAQVPGEIHLDLMRIGRMEDPNVSDYARSRCRWPEQRSWWYCTEFTAPDEFRKQQQQRLIFEGIDMTSQVFLNGKLAATSHSTFTRLLIDVKPLLKEGTNELVVRVTSGMEFVPPSPPGDEDFAKGLPIFAVRYLRWYRFIRKPDYAAYGTDWNDPLPNIGIWRDVRLEGRSGVVLHHVRLDTNIRGREVSLEGDVTIENVHPWSEVACTLELRLDPPKGTPLIHRVSLSLNPGRLTVPAVIAIPSAELWWPNGMGDQPIYQLTARILCSGLETDRKVQYLGLRTVALDRSALREGSRFGFRVNGHQVFGKGGNWVPSDLILARIEPERYRELIAEAKRAHFNMLRVNGAGIYESDEFYDACDRAGLLVWQDFAFSDAAYPDSDPAFVELVRAEAEAAVMRLRHHPSLMLWVGNSECNLLAFQRWQKEPSRPQDFDGMTLYNEILPEVCHFLDPARPYIASSPMGGAEPGGPFSGDRHGPYGMQFDIDAISGSNSQQVQYSRRHWRQLMDRWRTRFASEFGWLAPPHVASIREYLKPDELHLGSRGWKIHTNMFDSLEGAPSAVAEGIRANYGNPDQLSLKDFVLYGQMLQAQLLGGFVEAMRFRKNDPEEDCQGVLSWAYNDCWGETGWSIIDHYLRRKASFYWYRRACAPVKVLIRSRGERLVIRVVNDTLRSYRAEVRCGWIRLDGRSHKWEQHRLTIPPNDMIEVCATTMRSAPGNPKEWFYAATLTGTDFPNDQAIWLQAPHCELQMPSAQLTVIRRNSILEVSSAVYCHGVHLDDGGHEVLEDNYLELIPGVVQRIPISSPYSSGKYKLSAVMPIPVGR